MYELCVFAACYARRNGLIPAKSEIDFSNGEDWFTLSVTYGRRIIDYTFKVKYGEIATKEQVIDWINKIFR